MRYKASADIWLFFSRCKVKLSESREKSGWVVDTSWDTLVRYCSVALEN